MSLLNPPQILPAVARVLFRALQAADGFELTRAELAKSVAPTTLPRGNDSPSGPGSRGFDDTLTACLMIDLFDRDGEVIRLHTELPSQARDRREHDHHLQSVIRDLILRDVLNHGLWDSTEGARDLTRALAWYLAQDPLKPPAPWNEPGGVDIAQERQLAAGERIFSNDTRWGAFDRWATFLGFGRHLPRAGKTVLVPDPTEAIRHALPLVLTTERLDIAAAIKKLAERIPVLDGGTYRRDIEARMSPGAFRSGDDLLSPSLAYALLRLRDERIIVLEDLPDLSLKMRLPQHFGPERTITHASLASDHVIQRPKQ